MNKNILWITPIGRAPDGLSVRLLNFGRELRAAGVTVHCLAPDEPGNAGHFRSYIKQGCVDAFSLLPIYKTQGWRGRLAAALVHPRAKNFCRRGDQQEFIERLVAHVRQLHPDVVIVSDRAFLLAAPELRKYVPIVIDWCDSFTLASWRRLEFALRQKQFRLVPGLIQAVIRNACEEQYYPRFAQANIVVSPVDQKVLRRLGGSAVSLLPLGVDKVTAPGPSRVPDRLIFTGVMNFEPNYRSILWFIDRVLPLVRAARPAAHLVVAGRDPERELLARRSEHISILGAVPDLSVEIGKAQLFVAPMVLGSGFKNKVVEALAAGTPVIGTNMAGEFLPEDLKKAIILSNEPAEMAAGIVRALENPDSVWPRVGYAQDVLRERYSWLQCARELLSIIALAERQSSALAANSPAQ
jgi:glycosyltransferase involved in cell wall biosynthesis